MQLSLANVRLMGPTPCMADKHRQTLHRSRPSLQLDKDAARRRAAEAAADAALRHLALLASPPAVDRPRLLADGPPVPSALRDRVIQRVETTVLDARRAWGKCFKMPAVSFKLKGRKAGVAHLGKWTIALNPVLLMENPDEMSGQVVVHELAHLFNHVLHGVAVSAHGSEWKHVMVKLGVSPDRTHSMDVSNAASGAQVHRYRCGCEDGHVLSEQKHRNARTRLYRCTKCRRELVFGGEVRLNGVWTQGSAPLATRTAGSAPGHIAPRAGVCPLPTRSPVSPSPGRPECLPPSEAQVRYALNLSAQLGQALRPEQLRDRAFLSEFITRAKQQLEARLGAKEPPTERQVAYANALAVRRGMPVPASALASKADLSRWLDAHR